VPAVVCGNVTACLVALPLALPVSHATPADWLTIVFLGLVQIALAYAVLTRGMSRVPVLEASLLLLVEPVLNPVWAFAVHGEVPAPWAIAGAAIILAATAAKTVLDRE
jgi:drug/metabolite transporter (DMT)-like permease